MTTRHECFNAIPAADDEAEKDARLIGNDVGGRDFARERIASLQAGSGPEVPQE